MKKYKIVGPITNFNSYWLQLLKGNIAFYFKEKSLPNSENSKFKLIEFADIENYINEATDLFVLDSNSFESSKMCNIFEKCALADVSVHKIDSRKDDFLTKYDNMLYEYDIPIISISSVNNDVMMPLLEVNINRKFSECGYKVLQYSSFGGGSVFGFYDTLELLDNKDRTFENQIIIINNRLQDAIKTHNPDIVVIGIPHALFRKDTFDYKNIGVSAYVLSQSIDFDCNVQLIGYGNYSLPELKELSKYLKYRFEMDPNIFVVSNIYTMQTSDDDIPFYEMGVIDSNSVKKLASVLNKNVRIYDMSNSEMIYKKICECLQ